MSPARIWSISAVVSFLVHAALAVAASGADSPPRAGLRAFRDIRFLVDAARVERSVAPADREADATSRPPRPPLAAPQRVLPRPVSAPEAAFVRRTGPLTDAAVSVDAVAVSPVLSGSSSIPALPGTAPVYRPGASDPRRAAAPPDRRETAAARAASALGLRYYIERIRTRVAGNLNGLSAEPLRDIRGLVHLQVTIDRSGCLREVRYLRHSDHAALDLVAEQAVQRSAPFPALGDVIDLDRLVLNLPIRF